MDVVKSFFSIKEMETLSGIKAHTLRIWEARYRLFNPERTQTNIRSYGLNSLRKLLNITLLYKDGHKISKIARLSDEEIAHKAKDISLTVESQEAWINAFKISMIEFDETVFEDNFQQLINQHDFEFIFSNIFIPLLGQLGILWQTGTISIAHEHFITHLIKQKIHRQTDLLSDRDLQFRNETTFVLFLPENELHELALLYLNFLLKKRGFKTVFLGQSVPVKSLKELISLDKHLSFVTYLTTGRKKGELLGFINDIQEIILKKSDADLLVFGPGQEQINKEKHFSKIKTYTSIEAFERIFLSKENTSH